MTSPLDFNGDGNVIPEAVLGMVVVGGVSAARQTAEYQRQTLNLLREHQGLPPIQPPPPSLLSRWLPWAIGIVLAPFVFLALWLPLAALWVFVHPVASITAMLWLGYAVVRGGVSWYRRGY